MMFVLQPPLSHSRVLSSKTAQKKNFGRVARPFCLRSAQVLKGATRTGSSCSSEQQQVPIGYQLGAASHSRQQAHTFNANTQNLPLPALEEEQQGQQPQQQHAESNQAAALLARVAADQGAAAAALTAPAVLGAAAVPAYSLVTPKWMPLAGVSKQHAKVEREVAKAACSSAPLLITADAGMDILKLAATVHALGLSTEVAMKPLVQLDLSTVAGQQHAQQLLTGKPDDLQQGSMLLQLLTDGTLVLSNAHKAPRQLLALIAAAAQIPATSTATTPAAAAAADAPAGTLLQACRMRLVLLSQLPASQLQQQLSADVAGAALSADSAAAAAAAASAAAAGFSSIKTLAVPPLRARASDIAPMALQAALPEAVLRGYTAVELTDAAELQLAGYHWPGNEVELQGLVQRAVLLHPPAPISSSSSNSGCVGEAGTSCDGSSSCIGGDSSSCVQGCGAAVLVLDAADFWPAAEEADRHRIDILELLPWLKPLMLDTGLWPVGMNNIMKWMYPLVIISLFLGPQDRESSAALTVFWAGWWPLVLLSFPIIGRAWCAMCPFMLTGQVVQAAVGKDVAPVDPVPVTAAAAAAAAAPGTQPAAGQQHQRRFSSLLGAVDAQWRSLQRWLPDHFGWQKWQLQKWPEASVALWGNWALVAGFAAILCWEEVDDLPNHAALSGWLLLLITAGAVAFSMVFEKRLWCRHICPIGGMNGLFSKLSCTEIRSRPGICAATQCSRHCHKGRLVTGEAAATGSMAVERHSLATALMLSSSSSSSSSSIGGPLAETEGAVAALQLPGCPMNTYPAKHVDNKDCVMCANCLRACPSGSAQWRLRPPAADLLRDHTAAWHELTLMYVLLGAPLLHKLPELCDQLGLPQELILQHTGPHIAVSLALLAAPGAIAWLWEHGCRLGSSTTDAVLAARADSTAAAAAAARSGESSAASGAGSNSSNSSMQYFSKLAVRQQTNSSSSSNVPFLKLAYSMLPLVWAGNLAYYEELMLTELGLVLPRLALSLGVDSNAGWLSSLPVVGPAADPVVAAAQGITLLVGLAASWGLAGKVASLQEGVGSEGAGKAALPQRILMLAVTAELWRLLV